MTDIVLQRNFDPPWSREEFLASAQASAGCLDLYRVEWQRSLMSKDRRHVVCWFRAADAESVRMALRSHDVDTRILWPGSYHEAPQLEPDVLHSMNVAVERRFEQPVSLEEIQAIEDAGAQCLELRDVKFVCTLFSTDRRRMVCLYRAPDAESVREAQREAGMPFEAIWAFDMITHEALQSST